MSDISNQNELEELEENSNQIVKMVIKKPLATTQISLLIESLVQNLCMLVETDKDRALKIYTLICTKLFEMKLIDESFRMNEFEGVRNQYQEALYHLVTVARGGEEPLPVKRVWSNEEMNLRLSHYYREFDEIEYIAGGGFGQVYRVRHKLDGSEYAIKKIYIRSSGIHSVMNYLSEVKTFASLNHPNIVQYKAAWLELGAIGSGFESDSEIYNTTKSASVCSTQSEFTVEFKDDTMNENTSTRKSVSEGGKVICKFNKNSYNKSQWATLYIQMSLCQITLKQYLENRSDITSNRENVMDIFLQILCGIEYIHGKNIVHHDIKPSNIFIMYENGKINVQLGDFGLACPLQNTKHSLAVGTKLYCAPEQKLGECNPKSDMYSLGIVLLELTENYATDMERVANITSLHKGHLPVDLTVKFPELAQIIGQLVSRRPVNRPSASELLKKLSNRESNESDTVKSLQLQIEKKDAEISRLRLLLESAGVNYSNID